MPRQNLATAHVSRIKPTVTYIDAIGNSHAALVTAATPAANTNEVQSLATSGNPTGGTFTLTVNGLTTAAIAFNATAAAVATALNDVLGVGAVTTTGGALGVAAVVVTFTSGRNVTLMTIANNSLTGGTSPTATATLTTAGGPIGEYLDLRVPHYPTASRLLTAVPKRTSNIKTLCWF